MKKVEKKLLTLILAVVMLCTMFVGCAESEPQTDVQPSTDQTSTEASTPTAAENEAEEEDFSGTITISMKTRPGSEAGWNAVIEKYTEMHPNVTVVLDLKPEEGYSEWISNVTRSENPAADIAEFDCGDYLSATMIDLNDYLDLDSPYSDGTFGEQFDESAVIYLSGSNAAEKLCLFSAQVVWMYNVEIFEEVGVEPPETWDELVLVCEKLAAAGYQPISIDGDFNSYQLRVMRWLTQIYNDQTTRSLINVVRAQEGDYCFDPDIDGVWRYDPTDPWNDDTDKVTQNIVRVAKALYEGEDFRMDTAGLKTVWENFAKVFPQYCGGEAWFATNESGSTDVFYQGKAAMTINGGWGIVNFMRTMEELSESGWYVDEEGNERECNAFTLGTFSMPNMEGEGIEAKVRTIETPSVGMMVMSKDQEHNDMVMDFLMFYSSSEGMSLYVDAMLAAGGSVDGPTFVYDVTYPEDVASAFENVQYVGNAQKGNLNGFASGVPYVDESGREFYNNAYEYFMGNITVDEFLEKSQENLETYLPTLLSMLGISEKDLENPANAPAGE